MSTVIGVDLWNEPKPPYAAWGWMDQNTQDWPTAVGTAGNAILTVSPQWLIFVAGLGTNGWAGSDLTYVQNFPITLSLPNQLVYSTHELSQDSFNQTWFNAPGYPANLRGLWRSRWGYIVEQGQTPVFLGSFGTYFANPTKDIPWMTQLVNYMNGQYTSDGVNQLLPGQVGMSWAIGLQNIGILFSDFQTVDTTTMSYISSSLSSLLISFPLPTISPSTIPSAEPSTFLPSSLTPTALPSTSMPTAAPSLSSTVNPSQIPTYTSRPTSNRPSIFPTKIPSVLPTITNKPSIVPTQPTAAPTSRPTNVLAGGQQFDYYSSLGSQIVKTSNGSAIRIAAVNW